MWNPQFCFAFVFVFCRFKHISRGASGEEAQAGYKYSWSLFDLFHLGLKSSPCRKWDEVRRLTLAVWTCRLPAVHSVSRHLRATEQHALLCMSELCGPLKPRGPGLPIKMSWKLHFPISSGFWAEALWCKSKKNKGSVLLGVTLWDFGNQISVGRWQQMEMTSSINTMAAEREPCLERVKGLSPRQCDARSLSAGTHPKICFSYLFIMRRLK